MIENEALVLDMLEWLERAPRPYHDVMNAWRTSCPRLTVWEDAVDHRFVARIPGNDGVEVALTEAGRIFLHERRGTLA